MELTESVDLISALVDEALMQSAEQIGVFVKDRAKDNTPQPKTSRLRDSIDYQVEVEEKTINIAVTTNVEYAMYVEMGTGKKGDPSVPHTSKEFWRYKDKEGKWHTSHGQEPHPYLRPAVYNHAKVFTKIIEGQFEEVFEQ